MARHKKAQEKPQQSKQVETPKAEKVIQHLFRRERVEQKQKEGWHIVPVKPGHFRDQFADVILMEK